MGTPDQDCTKSRDARRDKLAKYTLQNYVDLVAALESAWASGRTQARPRFVQALERLVGGESDALLVSALDRLARSLFDRSTLLERHLASRLWLLSISESIDTHKAAGRLALNVITFIARRTREMAHRTGSRAAQARGRVK